MKLRVVIALIAVAALVLGALYMFGFRLRFGQDRLHSHASASGAPLATVRLLDAFSKVPMKSADIRAYNGIYETLGISSVEFAKWEKKNGYGSLGKDQEGILFIPGFPVFSKVAWMYIDPVDLSVAEVKELINECVEIESRTNDSEVKNEVSRLRALAEEADSQSALLRFDQP